VAHRTCRRRTRRTHRHALTQQGRPRPTAPSLLRQGQACTGEPANASVATFALLQAAVGDRLPVAEDGQFRRGLKLSLDSATTPVTRQGTPTYPPVESAHPHGRDQRRIEIAEVHAVPRAGLGGSGSRA
jgi:hypothetical protein